jgi:hypothetical protein
MSNTSVTYHYQFGVALDESGFNLVSAGLWTARPELFSYSIARTRADGVCRSS